MLYIGVDLGGTGIKAGVVNERGEILSKGSTPTQQSGHFLPRLGGAVPESDTTPVCTAALAPQIGLDPPAAAACRHGEGRRVHRETGGST